MPVAVFFCSIVPTSLHDAWEIRSPTNPAQRLPADRNDAPRQALHRPPTAAYVNLAFVAASEKMIEWFGSAGALDLVQLRRFDGAVFVLIMKKG